MCFEYAWKYRCGCKVPKLTDKAALRCDLWDAKKKNRKKTCQVKRYFSCLDVDCQPGCTGRKEIDPLEGRAGSVENEDGDDDRYRMLAALRRERADNYLCYGSNPAKWPNEVLPSYAALRLRGGSERRRRVEGKEGEGEGEGVAGEGSEHGKEAAEEGAEGLIFCHLKGKKRRR